MTKTFFLKFLLLVGWTGFMFFLSHQPHLQSGLSSDLDFILRKLAHITEYAVLSFLFGWCFFDILSKKYFLIFIWLAPLIYAISDEFHQFFIPGRVGSLKDVIIDLIGIFLVFILVFNGKMFYSKEYKNNFNKGK